MATRPAARIFRLRSDTLVARLNRFHPRVIDLSLDRVRRLLDRLGNPQRRLPPVVHVAGTNGKGSTVAFLRAILEAHRRIVHVYTSPHLVRFQERIVVAGREIGETELRRALQTCEDANAGAPITFFEITTAAAFLAFAENPADAVLLETGLGGRLDATNVIDGPLLTVLTPISLDHQAFLGASLAEIAGEKAGILKPGVACVAAAQPAEARAVIGERARAIGAEMVWQGVDWSVRPCPQGFVYVRGGSELRLPPPALAGAFQRDNAGLAVASAERVLGREIQAAAVRRGIGRARWPGRLQRLERGTLVGLLPKGWELWVDGAHNPAAAAVLAEELREWQERPVHMVFAMLRSKDAGGFLAPLAPWIDGFVTLAIPGEDNSLTAEEGAALGRTHGLQGEPAVGIGDGIRRLAGRGSGPARILVTGSLYLVGAVLAENDAAGGGGATPRPTAAR
jgi:dihydrofolate synthase/folylpolyglutamate synthase